MRYYTDLYDNFRTLIRTITSESESESLINYHKNKNMFIELIEELNDNTSDLRLK